MAFLQRAKNPEETDGRITKPGDLVVLLHALGADSPMRAVAIDTVGEIVDGGLIDRLVAQQVLAEGQPGKVYAVHPRSRARLVAVIALCALWAGIIAWLIARVFVGGSSALLPPIKVRAVLHACVGSLLAATLARFEWMLRTNSIDTPDDARGTSAEPWVRAGMAFVLHKRQRFLAVISLLEVFMVLTS